MHAVRLTSEGATLRRPSLLICVAINSEFGISSLYHAY